MSGPGSSGASDGGSPRSPRISHASPQLIASLIFAAGLSLYLLYPTAHYSFDAVAGGVLLNQWIASGKSVQLFHKYHILYLPLGAAAERALRSVGVLVDPLNVMRLINAFFAAAAAAVYYILALRLELDRYIALVLSVFFCLGYSYWYYATDAESYPVSTFFLLLAFLAALNASSAASVPRACLAGVCLALAVDFHITCIVALPAAALAVWPKDPSRTAALGARQVSALVLTTIVLACVPYGSTYLVHEHNDLISGFAGDFSATLKPDYRDTRWWSVSPRNLVDEWRGLAGALAPEQSRDVVSSHALLTRTVQWGLLALSLSSLLLLLPTKSRKPRARWVVLLAWFLPTFLFFSTWAVGSDKYAAYQWAPLLLICGCALERTATHRGIHLASLTGVTLLAVLTLVCSHDIIRKQSDGATNPHLQRTLAIAARTSPDDLVIHTGRGENQYQKVYLPYFGGRPSLILDFHLDKTRWDTPTALSHVGGRIDASLAARKRVLVMADVAEAGPQLDQFEDLHGLDRGTLARFLEAYRPTVLAWDEVLGRIWELHPPARAN